MSSRGGRAGRVGKPDRSAGPGSPMTIPRALPRWPGSCS